MPDSRRHPRLILAEQLCLGFRPEQIEAIKCKRQAF
jgi:hypothetical protein